MPFKISNLWYLTKSKASKGSQKGSDLVIFAIGDSTELCSVFWHVVVYFALQNVV